jgi:hypothetical protein
MEAFLIISNLLLIAAIAWGVYTFKGLRVSGADNTEVARILKIVAHNSELITKRGTEIHSVSSSVNELIKKTESQDVAIWGQNKVILDLSGAFNLNSSNIKARLDKIANREAVVSISDEQLRPLIKAVIEVVQDMPVVLSQVKEL